MELKERSKYLVDLFERLGIPKNSKILEIGHGDGRNLNHLKANGFTDLYGIDKATPSYCYRNGSSYLPVEAVGPMAVEDISLPNGKFDVVFTMSCLFLLPKGSEWVFKKIADMTKKYLITLEGETTKEGINVIGRDYGKIFEDLGMKQIEHKTNVFNEYGVLRVFKNGTS